MFTASNRGKGGVNLSQIYGANNVNLTRNSLNFNIVLQLIQIV